MIKAQSLYYDFVSLFWYVEKHYLFVVSGVVLHLTETVVFSRAKLGSGYIYLLATYSVFICTKLTIETIIQTLGFEH